MNFVNLGSSFISTFKWSRIMRYVRKLIVLSYTLYILLEIFKYLILHHKQDTRLTSDLPFLQPHPVSFVSSLYVIMAESITFVMKYFREEMTVIIFSTAFPYFLFDYEKKQKKKNNESNWHFLMKALDSLEIFYFTELIFDIIPS